MSSTADFAREAIAESERNAVAPSRKTMTEANAEAAFNDYERYQGKLPHIANDSQRGALAKFAYDVNQSMNVDGEEMFSNVMDPDAVLDRLYQAVQERRK